MRILLFTIFLITSLLVHSSHADSVIEPWTYVTASHQNTFFVMYPGEYDYKKENYKKKPYGVTYRVTPKGEFQVLWRVSGWYSYQTFLSDDGRYLVSLNEWPDGTGPSNDDIVLSFYDRGRLIRKYSSRELVANTNKVIRTTSHYQWLSMEPHEEPTLTNSYLRLKTIDGQAFLFDVATGINETK